MNTREQFGKYLLLKKLTEDPLGETFRAGMLGTGGIERVALLRVFNGQGVDGQRLWQAIEGQAGVQPLLRSPNLGEGIEIGEIQGIPYVAYDYVSGKNLANLLQQAVSKRSFIPAEHALLITERIALGLASAYEVRHDGARILHGFLTPHLVMISNEGETRLLGFEVAPGLRRFAANPVIRQHFGRYLSPETLGGAAPVAADDIYSLGVVLFELLTGKPLPPPAPDGFSSIIEQGIVATEKSPIPAELTELLKHSLVPRDERIQDIVTWHKTLNKWMFDGKYNPTTFNLAFFMHNLFRQEIERESQEIEVEKTLPLPVGQLAAQAEAEAEAAAQPAAADAPPAAAPVAREDSAIVDDGESREVVTGQVAQPAAKSKAGLLAAAVVLLALVAAGGYYAWTTFGGDRESARAAAQPSPPVAPPVVSEPEPPPPSGPTEEELNAQIMELIGERASEMEEQLRQQYDQQLNDLQKQLRAARKDADEQRQRELEEQQRLAAEAEAARLAEEEAARLAEEQRLAEAAAAAAAEAATEDAAEGETLLADAQESSIEVEPVPPPPPPPPPVQRGDLVEPGPGVKLPELVRRPAPRFPEMARRLKKSGAKVLIRALIDENGRVVKAELAGKKQGFGFDGEALNAAKKSLYRPATKNGVPVKIWHTLSVEFREQ